MKTLITRKDEKALKQFLALADTPELTFTYDELCGYIFGIAITPAVIQPIEWVPVIFDDEMPSQYDVDARKKMATLFTVLNKHIAAFNDGGLAVPFDIDRLNPHEFERVVEWTSGLEEALSLRPECWEEHEHLSDEETEHLANSLIVIEGIVYPEDAIDMFDHIPKRELQEIGVDPTLEDMDKVLQIQFFMLQALELSVETLISHAEQLEEIRQGMIRSSSSPFEGLSRSIDRNTPCPCGSGRKFGDCCSLSSVPKKQGRLIKVDFPQHGGKKKKAEPIRKSVWGSYQLEITIAGISPEIRRVVMVPGSFSLTQLHDTIQLVFGWQDSHMHQFQIGDRFYGPQLADDYGTVSLLDESRFSLADFENDFLRGVVYTYDFGDNWEHVILLERVIPQEQGVIFPFVVEGQRQCPPEDIGGPPMYEAFLRYRADPEGEGELKELFAGSGLDDFDPEYFSMDEINDLLKKKYDQE